MKKNHKRMWIGLFVFVTLLYFAWNVEGVEAKTAKKGETATGSAIETPSVVPSPTPSVAETAPPEETPTIVLPPESIKRIYTCGIGKGKVKISWTESVYATGYMVYCKKQGKEEYDLKEIINPCYYFDEGLEEGKKYYYKIVPFNYQNEQLQFGAAKKITYRNKQIVATNHKKYSYGEMSRDIQQLNNKYHGIVSYEIIGKSTDGRNIYDVVIGNSQAKKTLLVVSTLHAREYMASLLCMNQIEYYLSHYYQSIQGKRVSEVLDNISIHYIVMANPDGVAISQFGFDAIRDKALRKRLRRMGGSSKRWKANARGVDLNRNFPFRFKVYGRAGSEGFSGKRVASEIETRAIIKLVKALKKKTKLKGVINYHAMGSIIFGSCKSGCSIKKPTTKMYRLARNISGYSSAAGYPSFGHGSFREYVMYKKNVASITIEIGRRPCPGPIWEYPSIWRSNGSLVFQEAALLVS